MKKRLKHLFGLFKQSTKTSKVIWCLLAIVYVLFFMMYLYTDIVYTTKSGINFWNALFSNNMFRYYAYNSTPLYNSPVLPGMLECYSVIYDLPLMLVFAVWNLPLWILDRFVGVNIFDSFACLLWMKTILLVFLAYSVYAFAKLCQVLGMNKSQIFPAVFLYLTSSFVLLPLLQMSHYDIIAVPFALLGVVSYIKKKEKNFLLFFLLSGMAKPFSHMIFIPLLLLMEKRIWKIVKKIIFVFSPLLLQGFIQKLLPYILGVSGSYLYGDRGSSSNYMVMESVTKFLNSSLPIGFGPISLFLVAYISICVYCYAKEIKADRDWSYHSIYICMLTWCAFFTLTPFFPYWIILIAPYIILLIFQNASRFKVNMLLYMFFCTSASLLMMLNYDNCFNINTMRPMLFSRLFTSFTPLASTPSVGALLRSFGAETMGAVFNSIFIACIYAFVFLNSPHKVVAGESGRLITKKEKPLIYISALISGGLLSAQFLLFLANVVGG